MAQQRGGLMLGARRPRAAQQAGHADWLPVLPGWLCWRSLQHRGYVRGYV